MADQTNEGKSPMPVNSCQKKMKTVSALSEYLAGLELTPPTQTRLMKICRLSYGCRPLTLRLVDDLESAKMVVQPSCFANAEGDRKNCLISIPQDTADALLSLEETIRTKLSAHVPNIQDIWVSSIRPSEQYPPSLRCKINVAGPRIVKYFTSDNKPCDAPTNWKQLTINAAIAIRGIYIQKGSAGLLLDITICNTTRRNLKMMHLSNFQRQSRRLSQHNF